MADWFYKILIEGEPVEEGLYEDAEIVVEDNVAFADVFTIRLSTSQLDSGEWQYLDDERFSLFNEVTIKAGFTNGVNEVLIKGYITQLRTNIDACEGKSYLEIHGMGPTVLMNLEEKVIAWKNKKDSEIAYEIFNAYGFKPETEDTVTFHKENDCFVMQKGTDIQFLSSLAQRNGFECYVEADQSGKFTGYFRKPLLDKSPQKDLSIHFGTDSNLVYFRSRVDSLRPLEVGAAQIDIEKKEIKSELVESSSLNKLGKYDLQDLIKSKLSSLVTPRDSLSKILLKNQQDSELLKSAAQAVIDEGSWFVTVEGEINSEAYESILKAKRTVLVKGAGKVHSGKYYVTKVSYILTKEKYVQKFEARRNALELDGSEEFEGDQWLSV